MSRLVPIGASEQAEVMARVEAHLAAGGQLIELPRYVLHATAGVCPGKNLPSLQAWIGPRTAAVALEERVDVAQIVSRLNGVRARLAVTLNAQVMLAERRALEHAERKARVKLSAGTAERFKGFPDTRAVNAAGGVGALLDGAWTAVTESMKGAVIDASREKAAILSTVTTSADAEVQAEQYRRRGLEAVAFLLALLARRTEGKITGDRKIPNVGPAIRRASQFVEGASGSLDQEPHPGPPRIPPDVLAVINAQPELRIAWTWIHSFYGVPQVPFDPHVDIDGNIFTAVELEDLSWFPGDHHGCLCENIPEMGLV